ncbi:hypothetical protein G6O69_19175 [Pseudenhygromyxa sp. WMMC2535]|uniref:Tc toxin subunit A-related protein n=1 Tax=Pseudenhygromyxa sp. WMMC2535 TaxID=2712867 RepID=UPI001555B3E2|nr:neuraminidase-like domain-containing protein [Pseudenhygromyxa sp. WMMC2535]NVB39975.1 hypothetical protein [Pseudenhygromyxa sp. WMMC2535]
MSQYTISGRILSITGAPQAGVSVTVFERVSISSDTTKATTTTGTEGRYVLTWEETEAPATPWDLFVRAEDGETSVDSALLSDLEGGAVVDLILGEGSYRGQSEWERIAGRVTPLLEGSAIVDLPIDRIEWLARRADVLPTQLGNYIQAHRLADQRSVEASSCYAFLQGGLPADLPGLLRAGEAAWERALRLGWARMTITAPGTGTAAELDARVAQELDAMRELLVEAALTRTTEGVVNQRTRFDTAGLSEADQRTFNELWVARTGSISQFWTDLEASLDATRVATFQFTIRAAAFVGDHVEALEGLQAERSAGSLSSLRDLAAWSESDWHDFLVNREIAAPESLPGADASAQRQAYARALNHLTEDAYPTAVLRHSIARDEADTSAPAGTAHVVTFLAQNPDFDIERSTIANYLDQAADPWQGVASEDLEAARSNLARVQRVYRLTPRIGRYATTKALLDGGVRSAAQVVGRTREEFVADFGAQMPEDIHSAEALAGAVWDRASAVHGATVAMASQLALAKTQADFTPVAMPGADAFEDAEGGLAQLATILGNLDYCACEHCRSVFSPAAYLADLLHYLQSRPSSIADNALEALSLRRPDLRHVLLDCDNTNTTLPYIDLVNEVLEATLAGGLGESAKQTTWSAEELRAHPEHLDDSVYLGAPASLVHPWSLPFSLSAIEARTYLEHLGVPRAELMRIYTPLSPDAALTQARAGEGLGLSAAEVELVTGAHSAEARECWGFAPAPADANWVGVLNGTDSAEGDVGELLRRGGYSLDELRELLTFDFIDPDGNVAFQWSESCALTDASIAFLDEAQLERLHRFTRLQRGCQIPARMLNLLLVDALGGTLDADALTGLAGIVALQAELRLPWDELASFWSAVIDPRAYADGPRSLYDRRFRPKGHAVSQYLDPAGDALLGESLNLSLSDEEHLPAVLAGLRVSEADYQRLVASSLADDSLAFANLTRLFACATLARALRLSIEDFLTLAGAEAGLTGIDPFASPADTRRFIAAVERIRDSGLDIDELDWLLRDRGEPPFDEDQSARELVTLARGLQTILDETATLTDTSLDALRTNLGALVDDVALAELLEIVDLDSALTTAEQHQRIDDHLAAYMDAAQAKAALIDEGEDRLTDVPSRRTWLLSQIVSYQRRRALIIDNLSARFEVSAELADALAFGLLHQQQDGAALLGDLLLVPLASEAQIIAGIDPAEHVEHFVGWTKLAKAAAACLALELGADELEWYSGRGAWLDLDGLPAVEGEADASFESFARLHAALSLREVFPADELTHAQLLAAASLDEAVARFAEEPEWDASALANVAASLGYSEVADLEDEQALVHLREVAEIAARLGVSPEVAMGWTEATPSAQTATAVIAAVRAKYDDAQWQRVAAPLRDEIRSRQRDALVDAVLAQRQDLADRDALFAELLIDVEMSPCMLTSRIKQAISSVQLFIQRVLLGLEDNSVTLGSEAVARWEWMKNYRVWEANRKVFLYPENWIEPELRSDKSPAFETLEASLMQGILDEKRVEKALVTYLEGLDRVSKLEIAGLYEDRKWGDLWLLGRSAATPHKWFVRKRSQAGAWSPWEEVPSQISGEAVTIVVRERRVHLFWLTKQNSVKNSAQYLSFRISHVERTDDGWSPIQLSDPGHEHSTIHNETNYKLQIWNLEADIRIAVVIFWNPASPIYVTDAFRFEPASRGFDYLGSRFNSLPKLTQGNSLAYTLDKSIIGLQPGYGIEGQRYQNTYYTDQDTKTVINMNIVGGTWFCQGDWNEQLFDGRSSTDNAPALIHHPDIWDTTGELVTTPAAYDDAVRKYLLEPYPRYEQQAAAEESGSVNPYVAGATVVDNFWLCPEAGTTERLSVSSSLAQTQKLQDRLSEATAWSAGIPGVIEGLSEVSSSAYNPASWQATDLLGEAQATARASTIPLGGSGQKSAESTKPASYGLRLVSLFHPYSRTMVERLATRGIDGLYSPKADDDLFRQQGSFDPHGADTLDLNTSLVDPETAPLDDFDFGYDSPYGVYNWELFFHVPMLIAAKLTTEQRFEDAQRWHHRVFNPIEPVEGDESNARFWRIKPFVAQAGSLAKDQLEVMLGIGVSAAEQEQAVADFAEQVAVWAQNPFDPHAVARIRPGVYQRTLLRKYFDNLIAWADTLFRRDSIESINEATMLYVLVAQLLGPRPQAVPGPDSSIAHSYAELEAGGLDAFSNALVELESYAHLPAGTAKKLGCASSTTQASSDPWVRVPVISRTWYFCYPPNPELLKYWDLVEDRLWKIRHCQNIEGVTRSLALFEPPIDPGMLVRATAAGVDIQSVLAELDSGLPPYRFRAVHGRAVGFCASLRSLGGALLSAIERRDGEAMARLRSDHEIELLDRVRDIRAQQLEEAQRQLASLQAARATVEQRRSHYDTLAAESESDSLSEHEKRHFDLAMDAHKARKVAGEMSNTGAMLAIIPQFEFGLPPVSSFGGQHLANVFSALASIHQTIAAGHDFYANKALQQASFRRRREDWEHQRDQADMELARLDHDILAAQLRIQISSQELANHDLQVEQTRELDTTMREKFSNRELYDWMTGQLSTLYFQTHQLAFDLAKRAERAYRRELAIPAGEPIIKYGYWDSLRRGLLAGERLAHDLERLDLAYMDRDRREFELRKSVSLAALSPQALRDLQETGACSFALPEPLFDLDHPGHYLRRIRAMRVSIPAVVGPYTSLGARLELVEHRTRISPAPGSDYADEAVDGRFERGYGGGEAIATSTAVADAGLFNLDFRDERYLPFEYAGAVSSWTLRLPQQLRQFDYRSIADVVIHVDYTARDGGDALRTAAEDSLAERLDAAVDGQTLTQLIVAHEAFPNDWERLLSPDEGATSQDMRLPLSLAHFPYFAQRRGLEVVGVDFALLAQEGVDAQSPFDAALDLDPEALSMTASEGSHYVGSTGELSGEQPATWTWSVNAGAGPAELLDTDDQWLDRDKVAGLLVFVRYTLAAN